MSAAAVRLATLAALALFSLLHWMAMVDPAAPGRALAATGLVVAVPVALARLPRWAWPGVVVVAFALALVVGGVAPGDLRPDRLADVWRALQDGLGAVGGAQIPYAGTDADVALVLTVGGALLALAAGFLAAGGARIPPLVLLVVVYAVPAVAIGNQRAEFLRGALLAVLVVAVWSAGRVRVHEVSAGGMLAAAGAVLAVALAPALDLARPWFDYDAFAQRAGARGTETFTWDHRYTGIEWPRSGREVLRVRADRRVYLSAQDLEAFDGATWNRDVQNSAPYEPARELAAVTTANLERWTQEVDVSVRDLRSQTVPTAGTTASVTMDGRRPVPGEGAWVAGRDLHRGDAYSMQAYVPQPTADELRAAGTNYPLFLVQDTRFDTPDVDPYGTRYTAQFFVPAFFGGRVEWVGRDDGPRVLRSTGLAGTYALARRLLRNAATPYDYVRAVQAHLADGYVYDEQPPVAARTLPGFLLRARAGYCQQFAGAMALLLRMGGVPARVQAGFAPGTLNRRTGRYVVRDRDAHSWVQAWFPGIGWVTFDPTPAAAPPASQVADETSAAGVGDTLDGGTDTAPAPAAAAPPGGGGVTPAWPLAVAALAAAGLLALAVALVRTRGPRRGRPDAVGELQRALHAAGRPVAAPTTLAALGAQHPAAGPYLRALAAARYAGAPAPGRAERAALRRALMRGLPPVARARTWLALRPRG